MGRGREGKGEGGSGKERERVVKGEGGLDLDICPRAPQVLVTGADLEGDYGD